MQAAAASIAIFISLNLQPNNFITITLRLAEVQPGEAPEYRL